MSQIEYMHYRSANKRTGATIAILPVEGKQTALISVARCGPEDVFNKKIGRDVAAGRLRAYMEGRATMAKYVTEIDVPDVLKLKASVDDYVGMSMASYGLD